MLPKVPRGLLRQTNKWEQFSVGDRVIVYDPVSRGFPKFQKHYVGHYEVASKPIAGGVTYIPSAWRTKNAPRNEGAYIPSPIL